MASERATDSMPSVTTKARQPDIGDEEAVDGAGRGAREKPRDDCDDPMLFGLKQEAADDADEPHQRADREIDAAGEDHSGHADRHDADEREIPGDVVEIVRRGEGVRLIPAHHGAHDDERDRHPERLARGQPLPEAAPLEARDVLDGDAALDRAGGNGHSFSNDQALWIAPVMRPVTSSGEV